MRMLKQVGQIDENGRRFAGWRIRVKSEKTNLALGVYGSLERARRKGRDWECLGTVTAHRVWIKENESKRALRQLVKDCERFFGKETPALREARRVLGE